MVVCAALYLVLLSLIWLDKKRKWFSGIHREEKRILFLVLFVSNTIAMSLFVTELLGMSTERELTRNSYGQGSKTESYEVTIEGELEEELIEIEIGERQYTSEEIQEIFKEMMQELDQTILGENESRDRVETDLNLVDQLEGYPIEIQWELDNYEILNTDGKIMKEHTEEKGTLVEIRGTLSYGTEEAVYVTHVMIYPETKTGKEKLLWEIKKYIKEIEKETKEDKSFLLPDNIQGKEVQWNKKADMRGYYILILGICGCVLILWQSKQKEKEAKQKNIEQMVKDYPDIINKFTLLLSTGMTAKNVWSKIVQSYEEQKGKTGERAAYEEMCITYREMQSGISEAEAYERFGKRCGIALYMKFGAMLSQNLRKGNKGLTELLRLEAIQAFENRKSTAKQMGEEASTKLLLPMFGMLAVVMVMVIVPAFLSIQL